MKKVYLLLVVLTLMVSSFEAFGESVRDDIRGQLSVNRSQNAIYFQGKPLPQSRHVADLPYAYGVFYGALVQGNLNTGAIRFIHGEVAPDRKRPQREYLGEVQDGLSYQLDRKRILIRDFGEVKIPLDYGVSFDAITLTQLSLISAGISSSSTLVLFTDDAKSKDVYEEEFTSAQLGVPVNREKGIAGIPDNVFFRLAGIPRTLPDIIGKGCRDLLNYLNGWLPM